MTSRLFSKMLNFGYFWKSAKSLKTEIIANKFLEKDDRIMKEAIVYEFYNILTNRSLWLFCFSI